MINRCLLVPFGPLFLDRPNVQDHDLVERLQQPYVDALRSYIMIKRPNVSSVLYVSLCVSITWCCHLNKHMGSGLRLCFVCSDCKEVFTVFKSIARPESENVFVFSNPT